MVTTIDDARSTNQIHRRAALSLGLAAMAGGNGIIGYASRRRAGRD
jgi:hypothetical protein